MAPNAKQRWIPLTPDILGECTLRYPKLNEADTKGRYADNKFKTDLIPSAAGLERFKAWAEKLAAEMCPDVREPKLPIKVDKKDGTVFVTAKTKRQPILIDGRKNPINPETTKIRGGSVARIAGSLSNYDNGVYIMLDAVQIIELAGGPQGAEAFEDVEDGYVETTLSPVATADETQIPGGKYDL